MEGLLALLELTVPPEWVDYNGHMNDAAYAKAFSLGVDELMEHIGIDAAFREATGYTIYTLESHIRYLHEAHEGEMVRVGVRLLDRDAKRLHVLFAMDDAEGACLATGEQMLMGMDQPVGRAAPFPDTVEARVAALWAEHEGLPVPAGVGRPIGIRRGWRGRRYVCGSGL